MTALHPAAAGLDYTAEIALQSAALADAAEGNLTAPVEHCPGWTVADLVRHVIEVHWFWAMIAELRPVEPPADEQRPEPPADTELLERFRAGALHLVEVLRHADPQASCWTWAPTQQNVGFIQRHQVQEAAVHRWDTEHAAGRSVALDVPAAVDSVEEFLTFSVVT
ncbi:MAG TPA: maleylpyruvate isomerase family mycothiol-dependent enzyme, partial [Jatrophihabitans sp.]|nr:maleylpyruvate isomerase family mycothiol-dependent enzyme [Jatrophihabitans sp.]